MRRLELDAVVVVVAAAAAVVKAAWMEQWVSVDFQPMDFQLAPVADKPVAERVVADPQNNTQLELEHLHRSLLLT